VYDLINYYSAIDNIIQFIVDFWHILLVHDDDDDSLWFFLLFCYVVGLWVYIKSVQRAFILLQWVTSLVSSIAFLVACHICTWYIYKCIKFLF